MTTVLFILVYFAVVSSAEALPETINGHKVEMTPTNIIQYIQFSNVSYDMTDFTVCTWIKMTNISHSQTIFRLNNNKQDTVILWRLHVKSKQIVRVTIKGKVVASENVRLTKGQWNHLCFQLKSSTGVWAMFVNVKIHSVGQLPSDEGSSDTTMDVWKLQGTGYGIVGDDNAPCLNRLQVYGLYMTGSVVEPVTSRQNGTTTSGNATVASSDEQRTVKRIRSNGTAAKNRRQVVYEDIDDPTATTPPPQPFQWIGRAFALMKRLFTFVIIPFFKFVRNTFFQTRTVDDTVVDVSETRLTVSDVILAHDLPDDIEDAPPCSTSATIPSTPPSVLQPDDKQRPARRADIDPCSSAAVAQNITGNDLVSSAISEAMSPNTKRYLQLVSKSLSDFGITASFVKQSYSCCQKQIASQKTIINWHATAAKVINAVKFPASPTCGQF
ncbi:uncharacterized protein LOC126898403 [Daktulosphaira vitifoliae]|uniref:uncharacterized protein LOC126898403 n=1 Tax=Daktulosphaira vitifoliae TaxID=58002 RepID=UPI0021A9CE31|nr:uncharacterized protein LOC126898403 [Daktulosphaira vitifoliae]XP_050528358.1 uncharacterized protein LOC126898403 [Daktulosphaira vitifoliae]